MTRMDVLNSIALKKRFVKDCGLPISVFDNPYFMERMEAISYNDKGCFTKFDTFCSELFTFNNAQEYFEYYNSVKDRAIDFIKTHSPDYQIFINKTYAIVPAAPKKNLYVMDCEDGVFVSIDMKKANFTALHHFSKDIFGGADTWEDFMGMFTDSEHIKNSKYIRQVILGVCNPKKQINYEHFLMNMLCCHIRDKMPGICIYSLGKDEIIIDVDNCKEGFPLNQLKDVVMSCPDGIGDMVKVRAFGLSKINGTNGWLKTYSGEDVEFKCLDADIYAQVIKYYYDLDLTRNDLVFYHNGYLARFMKAVDNPWS